MNHQIDPETDPIAACLLIFAKRGAAIRAEQERILTTTQHSLTKPIEYEPNAESLVQANLDEIDQA